MYALGSVEQPSIQIPIVANSSCRKFVVHKRQLQIFFFFLVLHSESGYFVWGKTELVCSMTWPMNIIFFLNRDLRDMAKCNSRECPRD